MGKVNKKYVLGFLLIALIGVGLVIGGVVRYYTQMDSDFVETQGYVVSVETRVGDDGIEYRPRSLRYFVEEENKYYETSVLSWFSHPIRQGETMTVWYKKGEPTHTIVGNADNETVSYILIGIGAAVAVAGIALTCKYLVDVKRGKM